MNRTVDLIPHRQYFALLHCFAARPLLLAVAVVTAVGCAETRPQVVIDRGPVVPLTEGTIVRIAVDVADSPATGACAPPFDADTFEYEIEYGADLFEQLDLQPSLGGGVDLVVVPRCDAVAPGANDALVPITIRSATGCARERHVTLQIHDSRGDGCVPIVTAWQGDCAVVPDAPSLQVEVASEAAPQPLCVHFQSRDPAREQLWVGLDGFGTTVPSQLVDETAIDISNPHAGAGVVSIPLNDTVNIKGEFEFNYAVSLAEPVPGQGVLETGGTIRIRVGTPGLALTSPVELAADFELTELDVVTIPVRVWRLDDAAGMPSGDRTCLRASRLVDPLAAPPLDRNKPFSAVENALTGEGQINDAGDDVQWVCGTSFTVRASPPLDAPVSETIVVDINTCSNCGDVPTETGTRVTRALTLPSVSVAGQMACGPIDDNVDIVVACAGVSGATTPDVVFSKRGATSNTCVFAGDDSGRHQRVEFADPSANNTPSQMVSIGWSGMPGAPTPTPVILGRFPATAYPDGSTMRVLSISSSSPAVASWVPATDMGIANAALNIPAGQAFAADLLGGATHYAVPNGRHVVLTCIAPGNPVDCQTVTLADVAPVDHVVSHVARADLNGDGLVEVIAFATATAGPNYMTVVRVAITWSAQGGEPAEVVGARRSFPTTIVGQRLRSGSIRRMCSTPPCGHALYAVVASLAPTNELLQVRLFNNGALDVSTVSSLSATRDLAAHRNHLIVGMEFGVSEAVADGELVSWFVRDPVILEDRLVGPVTNQPVGYAGSVAPCVSTEPRASVAFTADTGNVRWTELNINVSLP